MKETDSERRRGVREENDRNSTRVREQRGRGGEEEGVTEHCFSRAERTKAPLCAVLRE